MRREIVTALLVALFLYASTATVTAYEEQDYGYWCTTCGQQHGPGENCPNAGGSGSSGNDEPYDWSTQPSYVTTTTVKTLAQFAREYNAEGEELYRQGKYNEAWKKFFAAAFNDPDTTLYKENRDKANAAIEREEKEQLANKKLRNVQPFGTAVVDSRAMPPIKRTFPVEIKRALSRMPTVPPPYDDEELLAILFLFEEKPRDAFSDDEMMAILMGGDTNSLRTAKKRLFLKNPEIPLINPLREPERYQAWAVAADKRLKAEANKSRALAVIRAMNADKRFAADRDWLARMEAKYIAEAKVKEFNDTISGLNELWKKYGLNNVSAAKQMERSDAGFRQAIRAIIAKSAKTADEETAEAIDWTLKQMDVKVEGFFARHPELKR